jgi:hypothetical protein
VRARSITDDRAAAIMLGAKGSFTVYRVGDLSWRGVLEVDGFETVDETSRECIDALYYLKQLGWRRVTYPPEPVCWRVEP